MGVIPCDRDGCESIMVDFYSHEWGRLCRYCLEELSRSGIHTDIGAFMRTPPDHDGYDRARAYFGSIFLDRHA